jgi:surface polysaccharide O-acyltransferase-like enzyme
MDQREQAERLMAGLFRNWGAVRWIRLGLAGALLMAGLTSGDTIAYAGAAFFALQAIFNFGCCAAACRTDHDAADSTDDTTVVYEEVRG